MEASNKLEQSVVSYARWVVRWRWPIVLASIVVTMMFGYGAQGLYFNTQYNAFFKADNPQLVSFEALQDIYTNNDNILFVVAPKDEAVFEKSTLKVIEELEEEAWKMPYALRVDAITNYQHSYAEEDDLIVIDLIESAEDVEADWLRHSQAIATNEPLLKNRLIDEDGRVTGVNVTLQLPGEDAAEITGPVAFSRELVARLQAENPDVEIHITGVAMLNNAFQEVSTLEMSRLLPVMFGLMILIMIFSLRSVSATIATMFVIGFSTIIAMGAGGWFSLGLTPPSAQAPTIIMTLAIADSIHFLVIMFREMRRGLNKTDAIVESIRVNLGPIFLTSVSTVIGFLSLNFSDVPPFNHLGNMTAVGVTAAFLLSVLFLPALISIMPVRVKAKANAEGSVSPIMDRLADFVITKRKPLLWGSTALVILFASLIPLNVLDDRFVEYFDESIDFRTASDFASDNLTGIYQAEFSIGAGESGGISNPEYLQKLDDFAEWYRSQPSVVHVNTFTDVMKRLNKNMHGDDENWYVLPDSRELAAQYLLLYELSLPYGLDLNNQINVDKSATRFTVTLENIGTVELRELSQRGEQWLRDNADEAMFSYASGPAIMFANVSGININSMLQGSLLALIIISFLMIFALRSLKLGLISFLPNLLPAVVAFGVWGVLNGVVNLGLSVVIGMTLGIVVDDSIHFLSKYRRARVEKNLSAEAAIRYAFSSVGRALVVTTVILVIGFLVLSTSAFEMNASMGLLTAITILLALIIDFFTLPPLLLWLDRDKEERNTPGTNGRAEDNVAQAASA